MNTSRYIRRLIPSFFRKNKEDVPKEVDHLLYEFSIKASPDGIEEMRKIILLNPYSLLVKPKIKISETEKNLSMTVSFFTLTQERGKEVENQIVEELEQVFDQV